MNSEPLLDYERLDVYRLARQLAREANELLRLLPPGRADLADQLRRATLSVSLNIAEGSGEFASKEKARFYRIAKRSATECGAVLDHMIDVRLLAETETARGRMLVVRITGALVKLIQSVDRAAPLTRERQGHGAQERSRDHV